MPYKTGFSSYARRLGLGSWLFGAGSSAVYKSDSEASLGGRSDAVRRRRSPSVASFSSAGSHAGSVVPKSAGGYTPSRHSVASSGASQAGSMVSKSARRRTPRRHSLSIPDLRGPGRIASPILTQKDVHPDKGESSFSLSLSKKRSNAASTNDENTKATVTTSIASHNSSISPAQQLLRGLDYSSNALEANPAGKDRPKDQHESRHNNRAKGSDSTEEIGNSNLLARVGAWASGIWDLPKEGMGSSLLKGHDRQI